MARLKILWVLLVCVFLVLHAKGQDRSAPPSVIEYHVAGGLDSMRVLFRDSFFSPHIPNIAILTPESGTRIGKILVQGARLYREGNRIEITPYNVGVVKLSIYAWNGEKQRMAFNKLYYTVERPKPILFVGNVKQDSIIKEVDLLRDVQLFVCQNDFRKTWWFPVRGFSLECTRGGKSVTLISNSRVLTPQMKRYIARQPAGTPLRIRNIRYSNNFNKYVSIESATLFIDKQPDLDAIVRR